MVKRVRIGCGARARQRARHRGLAMTSGSSGHASGRPASDRGGDAISRRAGRELLLVA